MRLVLFDEDDGRPRFLSVSRDVMQQILLLLNLAENLPPRRSEDEVCLCVIHKENIDFESFFFPVCPVCEKKRLYLHFEFDPRWKLPNI